MKVVEESRLCGGTDFGVHIQIKERIRNKVYSGFIIWYMETTKPKSF